ncbi:MAG TPA: hypothetical protein VFU07_07095 [Candidatus Lumbricidophila sp.]|nr:hypothetical protein [Candidatus Lumbricidophila sp.]
MTDTQKKLVRPSWASMVGYGCFAAGVGAFLTMLGIIGVPAMPFLGQLFLSIGAFVALFGAGEYFWGIRR